MAGSSVRWLAANEAARRFYERMGDEPVGEREEEIGGVVLVEEAYGWADLRARF